MHTLHLLLPCQVRLYWPLLLPHFPCNGYSFICYNILVRQLFELDLCTLSSLPQLHRLVASLPVFTPLCLSPVFRLVREFTLMHSPLASLPIFTPLTRCLHKNRTVLLFSFHYNHKVICPENDWI